MHVVSPTPFPSPRLLRLPQVIERTGLGRSSIYEAIRRGAFPAPVALTQTARAWRSHEIDQWIEERTAARNGRAAT